MMNSQFNILVVDDDKEIVQVVKSYLEKERYNTMVAYDGEHAMHIIQREKPHLVLLDLMLPDYDGWEITRQVRSNTYLRKIPIIMLTARIEDSDKLVGLELGADDYITKPFNPREVVARVKAMLRRTYDLNSKTTISPILRCGNLTLDVNTHETKRGDEIVTLTPTEFKILKTLMSNQNNVMSRTELFEAIFGYVYDSFERTLHTHIGNIRKKVDLPDQEESYIVTVYGIGYRMADPQA